MLCLLRALYVNREVEGKAPPPRNRPGPAGECGQCAVPGCRAVLTGPGCEAACRDKPALWEELPSGPASGHHQDQDQVQNQPVDIQLWGDPNFNPRGASNTRRCCLNSQQERQTAGKLKRPQGLKNNKTQQTSKCGNPVGLCVCF